VTIPALLTVAILRSLLVRAFGDSYVSQVTTL
jgi:hypothetical protein